MNYIDVTCFTGLEGYDCNNITKLVGMPVVGDYVEVLKNGLYTNLRIQRVIHRQRNNNPSILLILEGC